MYYIGKVMQAAGLILLLVAFLRNFPELMSYQMLFVGILLFISGWLTNRFLLKK